MPGGRKNGFQTQNEEKKPRQNELRTAKNPLRRKKRSENRAFFRSLFSPCGTIFCKLAYYRAPGCHPRSRKLFPSTHTELSAMAAAASHGVSKM